MLRDTLKMMALCTAGAALLLASSTLAEEGKDRPNHRFFNLHVSGGGIFAISDDLEIAHLGDRGGQGTAMLELMASESLGLSVLCGYNAFTPGPTRALRDLFIEAGLRLLFAVDRQGALTETGGNPWGHLWLDVHFGYHKYLVQDHTGFNVGLGYAFSLLPDFNLGPYVRMQYVPWGGGLQYGMTAVGLQASLGIKFAPDDRDGDKIEDELDKCPREPEDRDGFEDSDGCPDRDDDEDGVEDIADECPRQAGIPENKGCPDDDPDRDEIMNDADKCPEQAEDKDEFEDEDGCPDPDNDQDQLNDSEDKCPNQPEDKDEFEDEDGCPDPDNDQDGVKDAKDQCPDEPETKNGLADEDGCPDLIRVANSQIIFNDKIYFAPRSALILERSYPALEEVAAVLIHKKDMKVRIAVHTDIPGPEKRNIDVSIERADNLKAFLVERGVDASRIVTEGFGNNRPIADSTTKEGREKNDRVEIFLTK